MSAVHWSAPGAVSGGLSADGGIAAAFLFDSNRKLILQILLIAAGFSALINSLRFLSGLKANRPIVAPGTPPVPARSFRKRELVNEP